MDVNEYYANLSKAKHLAERAIADVESKLGEDAEFETVNYAKILNDMNMYLRGLERMIAVHKFLRLSKDAFMKKTKVDENQNVETIHTVKDYETPYSIAKLYNTDLEIILKKNNILTSDFVPGLEITVEINPSTEINKVYENIQTYGSQEGDLIFGKDAKNNLNIENGDVGALKPDDTFLQGINNRISTKNGEYPLESDFGLDELVGSEYPTEVIEGIGITKMRSQLLQDGRIVNINNITAVREKNAIKFTGNITAINNINIEI